MGSPSELLRVNVVTLFMSAELYAMSRGTLLALFWSCHILLLLFDYGRQVQALYALLGRFRRVCFSLGLYSADLPYLTMVYKAHGASSN